MRIAINTLPLKTAHRDRGIGYYTYNLVEELKTYSSIQVQEFVHSSEVKDVDLIHYPWFDFFFHSLPIKKSFPTVVTIHDVIPLKFSQYYPLGFKGKVNLYLQKLALRGCRAIITDSQASLDDIVKYLNIKNENITIIPLAADDDFKILSDTELIRIKRKYKLVDQFLLYVGDANWVKNLPFLIAGFKNLAKHQNYENFKLVLIGTVFLKNVENINHPELESLRKVNNLIKSYNLQNKIIRLGNIEKRELAALYNLATIYVQPSLYEGFGLPVLQAMACGAPVVCSNGGSLPEVGGNAAVYFDPTNINQFVSVVLEILNNRSLQDKLSKLGLKQAKKFNWKKVAMQTIDVYSRVIKNE